MKKKSVPRVIAATLLIGILALSACANGGAGAPSESASSNVDLTAVRAEVEASKQVPKSFGKDLTKLKSKPASDLTVVWLACDVEPSCSNVTHGLEAATAAAGTKLVSLAYKTSSVETLLAAFDRALAIKPDVVILTAMPKVTYASKLPALQAAGIPVIAGFVGSSLGDGVLSTVASDVAGVLQFEALANWVIADSEGKGKALIVNLPDFPYYHAGVERLVKMLSAACDTCAPTVLDIPTADLGAGAVPGKVVSALQTDPKIDYVLPITASLASGLDAALGAAGLESQVRVAGQSSTPDILQKIKAGGVIKAWTSLGMAQAAWSLFDQALRAAEGSEVLPNGPELPVQVLVQDNIDDPRAEYGTYPGFQDLFTSLWHVGQ